MRYRQLGSTSIRVSEIGFGTWGIGGNARGAVAYGPTDDNESRAALLHAVDLGINFFDTSDFYGFGHSEEVLGRVFEGTRSSLVIATKVGLTDAAGGQDFSPTHIERALEASLRRLRTDYVDLYQLHSPPMDLLKADARVVEALKQLKATGKIRAFGISVRSPEDGVAAVRELGFECLQVNFNLLDQRALEVGLFDLCAERSVGVIVRTPLVFGFLTGRYGAGDEYDKSDHRGRWSPAQRNRWAEANHLFTALIDRERGETPSQFALRFCLSFDCVSTTIPGMLTPEHVAENARASSLGPLPAVTRAEIVSVYRARSFYLNHP